ncbi:DUF4474 domain-containing protein [Lachnotalea glycerini]|uniref:DUF4474 domain-containing protein n=1 Tax=Lachnotalea glycerini TaxID=1763509 RepID=A0A371JAP9_9FIRM|nr:DUF4474 domain-containing protein [Lachnotalea glycerini]RDY29832.1 DUF4474 domain-containing protein [Lachnotalea glycerini]
MSHCFILPILVFVLLLIIISILFFLSKQKRNTLTPIGDTALKVIEINNELNPTGYYYSFQDDTFYCNKDATSRSFGYCKLYDETLPLVGMIVDCEPIYFDYDEKHWLIELWKGQYGMASGACAGIYNTANGPIKSPRFNGIFYESILDNDNFSIDLNLKKKNELILHKSARQSWFAGLKLGAFSMPFDLSLTAKITFPNKKMLHECIIGLKNIGYTNREFSMHLKTVTIHFTKPHTTQPASRTRVQETIIQQGNKSNCESYELLNSKCKNTIEKLQLLKDSSPELYDKVLKSFYSKEAYAGYELISPINYKLHCQNDDIKIDEPFSDSFDI